MKKAVVFDFDGVIVETEALQLRSYNALLSEFGREPISEQTFASEYVGLSTRTILAMLRDAHGIAESVDDLETRKSDLYLQAATNAPLEPRPGLVALLEELHSMDWELAIASSSSSATIETLLLKLGLRLYFARIFSAEEVERGKPWPDIYQHAVRELGADANRVVAVEDSPTGLESATEAGIPCIVVPSQFTSEMTFPRSALMVPSLKDVSHRYVASLINLRIDYVPKSATGYSRALHHAISEASQDRQDRLTVRRPKRDDSFPAQLAVLQSIESDPPDAVIIVPAVGHKELCDRLHKLQEAGVTVVTVDFTFEQSASGPDFQNWYAVTTDFREGGRLAAQKLLEVIGRKGSVAMLSGPRGHQPADERRIGFIEAIVDHAPDVRLNRVIYTNWHRQEGYAAAAALIQGDVELQGIFCANDNLAIGVADAYTNLRSASRSTAPYPAIIGFDGVEEVHDYLVDGRIVGSVDVDIPLQGLAAWQFAVDVDGSSGRTRRKAVTVAPHILSKGEVLRRRGRVVCFISYSHTEEVLVERIEAALRRAGFSVTRDRRDIFGGEQFTSRWRAQIRDSDVVIAIVSSSAEESPYVQDELRRAAHEEAAGRLRIVPVLTANMPLPDIIGDHHYVDIRDDGDFADGCDRLITAILASQSK